MSLKFAFSAKSVERMSWLFLMFFGLIARPKRDLNSYRYYVLMILLAFRSRNRSILSFLIIGWKFTKL